MSTRLTAAAAIFLLIGAPVSAHRLDEYLQATIISIEKDRLQALMRFIPGVAVSSRVLASIDTNADSIISETEQRAYAERVLRDLSLTLDGNRLKLSVVSVDFPKAEEMKEGIGEIQIEFTADLPHSNGSNRKLTFENHHQSSIAAYLANCLAPRDRNIRVTAQTRNQNQSWYQVNYVQTERRLAPLPFAPWLSVCLWVGTIALLLFTGITWRWRQRAKLRMAG